MLGRITTLCLLISNLGIGDEVRANSDCIRFSDGARRFLTPLHGSWNGFAELTPLGKMPYDVTFTSLSKSLVQGKSPTNGTAVHTWDFWYTDGGELMLGFHTTFGSSNAAGFCVTQTDADKGYLFSQNNSKDVAIWVNITDVKGIWTFNARIYINDKPHVIISSQRSII